MELPPSSPAASNSPPDCFLPYNIMIGHRQQFYELPSMTHGFSHGLKTCHRHVFAPVCALVPPFRILSYYWQRMRDSSRLRCRCGRARSEQGSSGALHLERFESRPMLKIPHTRMGMGNFWQRMRDSNPRERSQSPVCYRYTNPLSGTVLLYAKICKSQALFSHSSGFSSQGQGAPVRASCFRYRKVSFSPFSASMVST